MTEIEIDPGIRQAVTRSISKTENIRGIFDAKGRPVIRKSDVFHKRSDFDILEEAQNLEFRI